MLAWAMWAVSVVFVALSVATAGAILVSRLPGNVIGWLLAFCVATLVAGFAYQSQRRIDNDEVRPAAT